MLSSFSVYVVRDCIELMNIKSSNFPEYIFKHHISSLFTLQMYIDIFEWINNFHLWELLNHFFIFRFWSTYNQEAFIWLRRSIFLNFIIVQYNLLRLNFIGNLTNTLLQKLNFMQLCKIFFFFMIIIK